ncbi:MAG: RNA methyltransferase [Nitrospinota bacterium]
MALLHYPVYNKNLDIVVSSITTLDIHDISRIARTYSLGKVYIVTPLKSQMGLVKRLFRHWTDGHGASYNPTRKEALLKTDVVKSLEDVIKEVEGFHGKRPLLIATDAKRFPGSISYDKMIYSLSKKNQYILLFGTAWGIEKSIVTGTDFILEPIMGIDDYNHLPVRGAVAITLDRLFGRRNSHASESA